MPARLSLDEAKKCIQEDSRWVPFRTFLSNQALFDFIYYEKCCSNGDIPESRIIWEGSNQVGGYETTTLKPSDSYSPDKLTTFVIVGVWLPIEADHLFTTLENLQECPLISADGKEILFLIHPHSQSIYRGLLDNPLLKKVDCCALSLSSFRSLLVVIPSAHEQPTLVMVKISLDQEIEGVHRLLSMRECKLSVANTAILRQKMQAQVTVDKESLPITFVEDVLSYAPKGYEKAGGMIYRTLPVCLGYSEERRTVMPLLALYGVKNRDIWERLVESSGAGLTNFLKDHLLGPLARILVELLVYHQVSIQAHGQNLSIILLNDKIQGFLYRDMGGVNQLISRQEEESLPENLQHSHTYSYEDQHTQDVIKALEEHFVRRALFALTKQLCKSEKSSLDRNFKAWFHSIGKAGLLGNWTTTPPDSIDDQHQLDLPDRQSFCRYGYVEACFARVMIDYLKKSTIATEEEARSLERHFSEPEQLQDGQLLPPCSNIPFFERVASFLLDKRSALLETSIVTTFSRPSIR